MIPVVFSEYGDTLAPSASTRDIKAATEAARLTGWRILSLPPATRGISVMDFFASVSQPVPTPAVWIGFIPSFVHYEKMYDAARANNLVLISTPIQHRTAQEFDHSYPLLDDLTPASIVVTHPDEAKEAITRLGVPVFVKGAVQSRKAQGWKACVAKTEDELRGLITDLLALENRSRGRVIVRQLVPLRHSRIAPGTNFPLGREFRAFVYNGVILGLGYYWEGEDPLQHLSTAEESIVRALMCEAARRIGTPYIAIDVGQTSSGEWIVIETGDAQFSGASQVPLLGLWNKLHHAVLANTQS